MHAAGADADRVHEVFLRWCASEGLTPYPHQEEAILDLLTGAHTIVTTPTGSGKSLIALAAHAFSIAAGARSYYTAPIKALVSEKFF
ncbi:MAG TPA: DEAD/DEAH box helicase, partial [Propionibacteriaceae bacterium]|nr:DEAD/DEAH box helicase [Propionibacteriaceae bacterium]